MSWRPTKGLMAVVGVVLAMSTSFLGLWWLAAWNALLAVAVALCEALGSVLLAYGFQSMQSGLRRGGVIGIGGAILAIMLAVTGTHVHSAVTKPGAGVATPAPGPEVTLSQGGGGTWRVMVDGTQETELVPDMGTIPPEVSPQFWASEGGTMSEPIVADVLESNPGPELVVLRRHPSLGYSSVSIESLDGRVLRVLWNDGHLARVLYLEDAKLIVVCGVSNGLACVDPRFCDWQRMMFSKFLSKNVGQYPQIIFGVRPVEMGGVLPPAGAPTGVEWMLARVCDVDRELSGRGIWIGLRELEGVDGPNGDFRVVFRQMDAYLPGGASAEHESRVVFSASGTRIGAGSVPAGSELSLSFARVGVAELADVVSTTRLHFHRTGDPLRTVELTVNDSRVASYDPDHVRAMAEQMVSSARWVNNSSWHECWGPGEPEHFRRLAGLVVEQQSRSDVPAPMKRIMLDTAGHLLARAGDLDDALSVFTASMSFTASCPYALGRVLWIHLQRGDMESASMLWPEWVIVSRSGQFAHDRYMAKLQGLVDDAVGAVGLAHGFGPEAFDGGASATLRRDHGVTTADGIESDEADLPHTSG